MMTANRALAAAAFVFALPLAASAQTTTPTTPPAAATTSAAGTAGKLDAGKWTGTITSPSGDAIDVDIQVATAGDSLKIDMNVPAAGLGAPFTMIRATPTNLSFQFVIQDSQIKCSLDKKDDASYAGTCTDQDGKGGNMTMTPPKKGVLPVHAFLI